MQDPQPKLPLRPNVCIILINKKKQILIGERLDSPNTWQLPQGGVEKHLSLEENVIKEIKEEVGISADKVKIIKKLETTHEYEFVRPPDYSKEKWRGQTQTFWLVEFLGDDSEIDLNTYHEPEFSAVKWIEIGELVAKCDPIRKVGYEKVMEELNCWIAGVSACE